MIPKLIKFCKRLFVWIKTNNNELYLSTIIILVATISFGLGRLSKIREEKTPITIENVSPQEYFLFSSSLRSQENNVAPSAEMTTNASNKNVTEKMLEQKLGNISESPKIFVASRNGKKYYYAWCESANVIKEQNRVWFSSKDAAEKAGYQPAANCKGLK